MYAALFATGLNEGLTKLEICSHLESLKTVNGKRIWSGTPKAFTMMIAIIMLLDLPLVTIPVNGEGGSSSSDSEGGGGIVIELKAVMDACAVFPCFSEGSGAGEDKAALVDAFLQKCITEGTHLYGKIVKPYLDFKRFPPLANNYLGAIVPALLLSVRCRAPNGGLGSVTGQALHASFISYFLSDARSNVEYINSNIDLMLLYTSVAHVPITGDDATEDDGNVGTSGAERGAGKCYVRRALQTCLSISPTETTTGGAVSLIAPWEQLTAHLSSKSVGFRPGGPAHLHFGEALRVNPTHQSGAQKRNSAKRKAEKLLVGDDVQTGDKMVGIGGQKQRVTTGDSEHLNDSAQGASPATHPGTIIQTLSAEQCAHLESIITL